MLNHINKQVHMSVDQQMKNSHIARDLSNAPNVFRWTASQGEVT